MSCPRCAAQVRPPDLMHSDWRCDNCGDVYPFHVAEHISSEIIDSVVRQPSAERRVPLWCPWPLPPGWMVTGVGWAGDERSGVRATALSCSGPDPLGGGPADLVLIAEQPGVGLGTRFAGIPGIDPGYLIAEALSDPSQHCGPHAKIKAGGHPTPLWCVKAPEDRSAYVSEAKGMWLYAVAWPASAGYFLAEHVVLHDLSVEVVPELVYGAPSPYLHGRA
ncbi:hypothetical protein GCM10010435_19280 [Winogradskya consettensis]|uniref:Uncharacterized protein n=1 Tax=Winogradskya consettensis TaxID=113560 RepID=A0A919SWG4_9ACTN|nr:MULTISPECIES: DUF6758 family protein [Actinoplanes]GIM78303.1 hypothetical protein Aco04nite_59770 [Actinoplanes consettensis]